MYLTIKRGMSVCDSLFSRTVHPIYFTLGRFVGEEKRKCSVAFQTICTCDMFNISDISWGSRRKKNRSEHGATTCRSNASQKVNEPG